MNNRELVKAVKRLTDTENRYIIALDNSFDNVQIYMEQKILKDAANKRDNVFLLNIIYRIGGNGVITIFKNKRDIPGDMDYVELNDLFFNQNTVSKLDDRANAIVEKIDASKLIGKYKMESKFNGVTLDIDCLSTGCKTVLNVMYFPNMVFCMKECGDNALEVLYGLETGAVYSDYAIIPFDMETVKVSDKNEVRVISDYEELKEWWNNEE